MRYDKYEKRGALHWEEYENKTYYKDLVDDSLIPFEGIKSGTLLDVGCGDALTSYKLSKSGLIVTGIDIEHKGIELAKEKCGNSVELINISLGDFLKQGRFFDYLYCLDVIEHLENHQELVKIMSFINKFGVIITDDGEARAKKKDRYHVHEFSKQEFRKLFSEFRVEEIPIKNKYYFGYKVYATKNI